MRKITPSEKLIIERLIFPETFEVIQEETELPYGALRDDIINLVNFRLIEISVSDSMLDNGTGFYDSDKLNNCTFRATSAGLKQIKQFS